MAGQVEIDVPIVRIREAAVPMPDQAGDLTGAHAGDVEMRAHSMTTPASSAMASSLMRCLGERRTTGYSAHNWRKLAMKPRPQSLVADGFAAVSIASMIAVSLSRSTQEGLAVSDAG